MCIAEIDSIISKKKLGYKVVIKGNNSYFTGLCDKKIIQLYKNKFRIDPNKNNFDIRESDRGFHVCLTLSGARLVKKIESCEDYELVIVKVLTRKTVCSGRVDWSGYSSVLDKDMDFETKTLVVQELKILEEVK